MPYYNKWSSRRPGSTNRLYDLTTFTGRIGYLNDVHSNPRFFGPHRRNSIHNKIWDAGMTHPKFTPALRRIQNALIKNRYQRKKNKRFASEIRAKKKAWSGPRKIRMPVGAIKRFM